MVGGDFATEQLHGILTLFRENAGMENTPRTACRCGDSANDLLRKILFVVRTDAGLPDLPTHEWRPGDTEWGVSIKILSALDETGLDGCRCGDRLFDLWRKILNATRAQFGVPDVPEFSYRPGDSLNVLLRKLRLLLDSDIIVVPCEEMNNWGGVTGPIVCFEDWGLFAGPIIEFEDWGNV